MISQLISIIAGPLIVFIMGGFWQTKIKICKMRNGFFKTLLTMCYYTFLQRKGSWIGYQALFNSKPFFPHGIYGIFISSGSQIGSNCTIFHQVTIGSNTLKDSIRKGYPQIGDNCYIGAGAKLIGRIKIGDNCRIGANAVVYEDMPDNSVAVAQPTRIIIKGNIDNHHYIQKENDWYYFEDDKWIKDNSFNLI